MYTMLCSIPAKMSCGSAASKADAFAIATKTPFVVQGDHKRLGPVYTAQVTGYTANV